MDQELVKSLFDYQLDNGALAWRSRPVDHFKTWHAYLGWNKKYPGQEALTLDGKGYRVVTVFGKRYLVHRLIWLYVYGDQPKILDHINGIKTDNRINNLREVTTQTNNMNRKIAKNNTSGVVGVYFNKKSNIWCAQMKFDGVTYHLGSSNNFDEAVKMRKAEQDRLGFSKRHGEKC
jgi:hypothetical protein